MKMKPTLVLNGHHELGAVTYHHGEEMPPDQLSGELLDWWLEHGWIREHDSSERRSLHRLFSPFSGCSETENFSAKERAVFGLDE